MSVIIMATPVVEGPPIIGNASEVCVELWGTIPSGQPRYIVKALSAAREGAVYRGYELSVLKYKPIVLPPLPPVCDRDGSVKYTNRPLKSK